MQFNDGVTIRILKTIEFLIDILVSPISSVQQGFSSTATHAAARGVFFLTVHLSHVWLIRFHYGSDRKEPTDRSIRGAKGEERLFDQSLFFDRAN